MAHPTAKIDFHAMRLTFASVASVALVAAMAAQSSAAERPRLSVDRAKLAISKSVARDQHGSARIVLENCHRDEVHRRIVVCWTVARYGEDEDAWLYAAGYRKGRLVACNVVFASCPWTDVE